MAVAAGGRLLFAAVAGTSVGPRVGMVRAMSSGGKLVAPPMVYIKGEEMTRYASQLMLDKWIEPHLDTAAWRYFDLSCVNRDDTLDKVRCMLWLPRARVCLWRCVRTPRGSRLASVRFRSCTTPSVRATPRRGAAGESRRRCCVVCVA